MVRPLAQRHFAPRKLAVPKPRAVQRRNPSRLAAREIVERMPAPALSNQAISQNTPAKAHCGGDSWCACGVRPRVGANHRRGGLEVRVVPLRDQKRRDSRANPSNFKIIGCFSIANHRFSGAILHHLCIFNRKFRNKLAFIFIYIDLDCNSCLRPGDQSNSQACLISPRDS